mmetsp:Transcript_27738/g.50681  ORF Transcript_27738/g.50681 Transcript_27738/m.50681 type:complete len:178 (-) Transcript_27738:65-598(-)
MAGSVSSVFGRCAAELASLNRLAALIVLCSVRALHAELDLTWTQYSDAAELPMSNRWRSEMRRQLMTLDTKELTPALKMKRTMLLRRLDADDDANPPPLEDPVEARIRSYQSMKLEDVLFWSVISVVIAASMSFLVTRGPELVSMMGDSARTSRSGGRRRGAGRKAGQESNTSPPDE